MSDSHFDKENAPNATLFERSGTFLRRILLKEPFPPVIYIPRGFGELAGFTARSFIPEAVKIPMRTFMRAGAYTSDYQMVYRER